MRDAFSSCNPLVNFVFFAAVLVITVFFLHPVLLGISLVSALAYSIYLNGAKAVRFNFALLLPLMLVAAFINPAFNHAGMTILLYVDGNPITLEAILRGVAAAVMIGSVIVWFSCYNTIMTSDKFLYLFGRIIPAFSLILSMALRFIPRYKAQLGKIADAQRGIGRGVSQGRLVARVRNGLSILSILVTWALENAIEMADSMKSRGYGLKGRTAYSNYGFDVRDRVLLAVLLVSFSLVVASIALQGVSIDYFPVFIMNPQGGLAYMAYAGYTLICLMPLLLDSKEELTWRSLQSRI